MVTFIWVLQIKDKRFFDRINRIYRIKQKTF
jgi:hypothetical protein